MTTTTARTVEAATAALRWEVDPGHAWLIVDLHTFPEAVTFASTYSYRRGDVIALEEDCDAPDFLSATPAAGVLALAGRIETTVRNVDSPVRSWSRVHPGRAL